jgi:TonB dependent receptor
VAGRGLGLALLLILPAAVPGAAAEASLQVRVVDASHRALPEVSATLASIDGAGAAYTARAESGGVLAFYDIGPGAYRLRVEHAGLAPASSDLRLGPGETGWLTAVLAGGEGSSRIDDLLPEPGSYGTTFDADALHDLPSSRDAWSLLETAETSSVVDRLDNGGLQAGQAPRFSAHGGPFAQASYRFGAADVTDPFGSGAPLLLPDLGAVGALDVLTALVPLEEPGSGPLLVMLPPRPSTLWRGSLEGAATTSGLQAEAPPGPPPIARYDSWRRGAFSLAGPLVRERLGLAVSGSAISVSRFARNERDPRDSRARSLLAHLVRTDARTEARLLALVQDARHPDPAGILFGEAARRRDAFAHLQAGWTRRGETGAAVRATAAYARLRSVAEGRSDATVGEVDPVADGPIPGMLLGGPGSREHAEASLVFRAAPEEWRHSFHAISLGVDVSREEAELFASGPVTVGEMVGGRAARVWEFPRRRVASRWSASELAAHLADRARFGDRLVVEAGARVESTRTDSAGPSPISWFDVSPRLRARLRLDQAGRLALFGGWSRRRDRLPLSLLAFGDPTAPSATVSRWRDDGDGRFAPGEQGRPVAFAGPGGSRSSIDPDLAAPRADELVAGVEARLGPRAVVRFIGIDRRGRRLVESVNVGVPRDRYRTFTVFDPGGDFATTADDQQLPIFDRQPASFGADQYLVTNAAGLGSRYQGVELVFDMRPADGLRLLLGATAHRSEGSAANRGFRSDENDPSVPGELFDDPNADTFASGRLFFDRAYTIKIAAWYSRGRHGPRLGTIIRYQDGQPFARLVVAPDLAQGPEAVRAIPNGRSRFAYTLSLDARAEQGIDVGRARLSVVVEGFNLLGTAHEVEEDVLSGPAFRTPTAQQPPRALRLGLRLDF